MTVQGKLIARFTQNIPPGRLEWIGLRSGHRQPMVVVPEALALEGLGLQGDHRCDKTPGSARQVTIISREFIAQTAQHLKGPQQDAFDQSTLLPEQPSLNPALLRRNLVVSGINLNALRYQTIQIGEVLLELTAICHPCSRMETALGPGAVAAMLGYGGFCAKVLRGGVLKVGDWVEKS